MNVEIIVALIGALGAILVVVVAFLLDKIKFPKRNNTSKKGIIKPNNSRKYDWSDVETGVNQMVKKFEEDNLSNVVILTTVGSASVVAGLFKKRIEKEHKRRFLAHSFLLESRKNPWPQQPTGFMKIETARFNLYIPDAVFALPKTTNFLIVDSVWITGDTIAKLREALNSFDEVKVYFLLRIENSAPGNKPPDFCSYESSDSAVMLPWGVAS